MCSRDYIPVPGFPELRACVRPLASHSRTISLCYVGPMNALVAAGVATVDMLTTATIGVDAAGDHYMTDAHWQTHGRRVPRRYRIWRKMKRVRALQMPGACEALAHAAATASAGGRVPFRTGTTRGAALAAAPPRRAIGALP
jgi:hypothetical protein